MALLDEPHRNLRECFGLFDGAEPVRGGSVRARRKGGGGQMGKMWVAGRGWMGSLGSSRQGMAVRDAAVLRPGSARGIPESCRWKGAAGRSDGPEGPGGCMRLGRMRRGVWRQEKRGLAARVEAYGGWRVVLGRAAELGWSTLNLRCAF